MKHSPPTIPHALRPAVKVRVGIPLAGGRLVEAARSRSYATLFSANAFSRVYSRGHERAGHFQSFRLPDHTQFAGLDATLDSAGFVAAVRYGDYRWAVEDYFDLVESHPWAWYAAMDYCCEPEIAGNRPLRLLRMAATAQMLGRCNAEAARRGLPPPMPVLQGWNPADYATCAEWLPLLDWPDLVGIGSVCRRQVAGPDGILAILGAVDVVLPAHVRVHLFGVKSAVLDRIAHHPRVASIDSMAWDFHARAERRTGRDMDYRIGHMQAWANAQREIAARPRTLSRIKIPLSEATSFGNVHDSEGLVLEALALVYANLIMSGELDYLDAVAHVKRDGATAVAMTSQNGLCEETLQDFDDLLAGLGARVQQLRRERGH
ncbi:hypothetical protein [Cupriavidus sp. CuC1]|uniref:deazapurine DNA modification protein DpdA family protein n=1 Tax=Cupriavidus sp. CuC1 TaxID=3373131 RepID=UPI0037D72FB4